MSKQIRNNSRGSEWRIWDLHVHTPASYGGSYETFVENASRCVAAVIGINDYATLEGYEAIQKLGGIPGKVMFPVIELRMQNVLITKHNPKGIHLNFHIIFDNDPEVFPAISNFVNSLDCHDKNGTPQQLGTASDRATVTFNLKTVIEKLKGLGLYETHSMVWLPYDEYGGIDEIDPNTDPNFKALLIKEAHMIGSSNEQQIKFFRWEIDRFTDEEYRLWFGKRKPCIKGSDAHDNSYPFGLLQNHNSQPTEKHCWICADTTFAGLRQVVFEPERVFIGREPNLLRRVRENKTKFIRSIRINRISDAELEDIWFENVEIELNNALVAIIGNKGSGKSALTDILGLCGNTRQDPENFSFLTKTKFRKPRPENLSEKFEATLTWEDGNSYRRRLSDVPDLLEPERIRYIPQHFFETVCTSVESKDFESELKQIVFTHTPKEKRLEMPSLDALIDHKSKLIDARIAQIKSEISALNRHIQDLEEMSASNYLSTLTGNISLKTDELAAHDQIQPSKPQIEESDEKSQLLQIDISQRRETIEAVSREVGDLKQERITQSLKSDDLDRARQNYESLGESLKQAQDAENEFVKILLSHGVDPTKVFSFSIDVEPIKEAKAIVDERLKQLDTLLDESSPDSRPSTLAKLETELATSIRELDKPAQIQQQYLTDLSSWEQTRLQIIGDSNTDGTLSYFKGQLEYLEKLLPAEIQEKYEKRLDKFRELYAKKIELRNVRQELFDPVSAFVRDFPELRSNYNVQLDVGLKIKNFAENFFTFINQNKIGSFQGKEDGYKRVLDLIEQVVPETEEGIVKFIEQILEHLKMDYRQSPPVEVTPTNQLKQGKEISDLYDFIFHVDYVEPVYNLKLGEKTLSELSPGERGALLLIFYLLLDMDDIPLVIDQPEDNLDNESIFLVLVNFIKRVKNERQIIIVTHNPNLAIVCDAEQIIHTQIEKENRNRVIFSTGAIEESTINRTSINILEGTLPAFDNRDSKYFR